MISIIIPTLNEEKYIGRLLDSIMHQTYKKYEIVVIDGNSTDRTPLIVKEYQEKIKKLFFFNSNRKNKGFQSNLGVKKAIYQRLLFLDADDELQHDFLEKTLKELDEKGFELATCYVEPMSTKIIDKIIFNFLNLYIFLTKNNKSQTPGYCIFSTKKLHKKIKGFDENIKVAEDFDYSQKAGKIGKFGIIKSIKIRYCMRRFDEEGRIKLCIKYIIIGISRFIFGEIKTDLFKYKLGEHR